MDEKGALLPEGQQDNPRSVQLPFRPAEDTYLRSGTPPEPDQSPYYEQRVPHYHQNGLTLLRFQLLKDPIYSVNVRDLTKSTELTHPRRPAFITDTVCDALPVLRS